MADPGSIMHVFQACLEDSAWIAWYAIHMQIFFTLMASHKNSSHLDCLGGVWGLNSG